MLLVTLNLFRFFNVLLVFFVGRTVVEFVRIKNSFVLCVKVLLERRVVIVKVVIVNFFIFVSSLWL